MSTWLVATSSGFCPSSLWPSLCVSSSSFCLSEGNQSELRAHPDNPGSPHLKTPSKKQVTFRHKHMHLGGYPSPDYTGLPAFFLIARLLALTPLGPMDKAQHNPHEADE